MNIKIRRESCLFFSSQKNIQTHSVINKKCVRSFICLYIKFNRAMHTLYTTDTFTTLDGTSQRLWNMIWRWTSKQVRYNILLVILDGYVFEHKILQKDLCQFSCHIISVLFDKLHPFIHVYPYGNDLFMDHVCILCVCTGMKELDFATANNTNYLYTTEYNLVDFNVDENGLWVIYSTAESNNTIVSMLNPITLEALYSLNISINHHKVNCI